MADEPTGGEFRLLEAFDRLRREFSADVQAMESRLMGAIADVRGDQLDFVRVHGADHEVFGREQEKAHSDFRAFMETAAIAQAHRDGALGVIRYVVELLGRNWKAIAAVAATVAAATGNVRIEIG